MKQTVKGMILGIAIGAMLASGITYAKTAKQNIEVSYDNIKVYKDNVLCELKDANGSVIEPFIYNGTTYMPLRGTASLADMQVTWDGNTKSVYLWDDMVPEGTFLLDVCPPYSTNCAYTYLASKGESFKMVGEKYSNGLVMGDGWTTGEALFNLNSNFSNIECVIGHVDGYDNIERSISFIVDGNVIKTFELEKECLPKKVSIPVNYGLQLKIVGGGDYHIGIGNITVR